MQVLAAARFVPFEFEISTSKDRIRGVSNDSAIWRMAAAVGSLWGATEIVLGSALHNLQIPLRGFLLTAIGMALLVAAHQIWPVRGLFWRAGLVCASLKLLSPSAAIIGPMIAITCEGFLLEIGFVALGRTKLGYFIGCALAMCEPLLQKIATLYIQFGSGITDFGNRILKFAEKYVGVELGSLGTAISALLIVCVALGFVVAALGLRVGKLATEGDVCAIVPSAKMAHMWLPPPIFRFSVPWLVGVIGAMIFGLVLPISMSVYAVIGYSALFAMVVSLRYAFAAKRLARPGVWISLSVIVVASAFLLAPSGPGLAWDAKGFNQGLLMASRALLIAFGFCALSVELRNPRIGRRIFRNRFRELREAFRSAAEALPATLGYVPKLTQWKRPLSCLAEMVAVLPQILDSQPLRRVWLISGESGEGKTTRLLALAEKCRSRGFKVGGIAAVGEWSDGEREGFDILDLDSGKREPLCRREVESETRAGPFGFFAQGIDFGTRCLSMDCTAESDVVFVDELGPLEKEGGGWSVPVRDLLTTEKELVLVVRRRLVDEIARIFAVVFDDADEDLLLDRLATKQALKNNEEKYQDANNDF